MLNQTKKISVVDQKLRNSSRALNHMDILCDNISAVESMQSLRPECAVLEFHPCDTCDLNCFYCTYRPWIHGDSGSKVYPYSELRKVVALNPRAIVFAGGGEPTMYQDAEKTFGDVVAFLRRSLPKTDFGLTTNGACVPEGCWPNQFSWVRVSLDAATERTFQMLKDGDYEARLISIGTYLRSQIKHVGIGFLYNRFNVAEIPKVIRLITAFVEAKMGATYLSRVNIQFRPTCMIASCSCPSQRYIKAGVVMTPDTCSWWRDAIAGVASQIKQMERTRVLADFMRMNTNIYDALSIRTQVPIEINRCYMSLLRWIVRPSGDVFPCVLKASSKSIAMGNVLIDTVEEIGEQAKRYFLLSEGFCKGSAECCRLVVGTNKMLENELNGRSGMEAAEGLFF